MPQYITSTGPVLQCRPRWHSVGIGQRAKLKFPHGRVPRTPSPVFPLPALPAKVFRSACLPAQPASLSSRPSVLRKLFVVPCGMCNFSSYVLRLFGNGLLRRYRPFAVEYLLSRDRRAVPLFLYETFACKIKYQGSRIKDQGSWASSEVPAICRRVFT